MKSLFFKTVAAVFVFLGVLLVAVRTGVPDGHHEADSISSVKAGPPKIVPLPKNQHIGDPLARVPVTGSFLPANTDISPLTMPNNMLQFTAAGHVLGFQPTKAYLASLDHALSVEFLGTKGVMPKNTESRAVANTSPKAPALQKVVYDNLWEGINLTYEESPNGITESTYYIAPNADVSQIKLRYNAPLSLENDGSLKFAFETGYITESKPIAWQHINGERVSVTVAFHVSNNEVSFSLGTYNPREPLIIDPTYAWHTFYGSSDVDYGYGIAVDTSGNIYVTGSSYATWGSPLHAHSGDSHSDIFVLKLNSSGVHQWHTFYGSYYDKGYGIAVDTSGNVYVTGLSNMTWGSPINAYSGGDDFFVLKLNSSGAYQWHTFYGSWYYDEGQGIAFDTSGNVYITGSSRDSWGSPLNAFSGWGFDDLFILKLNSSGAYQWHTFYGSNNNDYAYGIAVDTTGNVYVTGKSDTTWGSPLHAYSGTIDILVLKLNTDGAYQWHTFYGASNVDYGRGIALDTSGNVYITGDSWGSWGSPLNAYSGYWYDLFVLKLNGNGAYQWHTFYGSDTEDHAYDIAVDGGDNVYTTGHSSYTWGLPLNDFSGGDDFFVLKLNSSGAYQWHTFYGSNSYDYGTAIAVDTAGNVCITGYSDATWGSPLNAHGGNWNPDVFALKLSDSTPLFASFGSSGVYKYEGSTWTKLAPENPEAMAASGSTPYADLGVLGLWKYDGTSWSKLAPENPENIAASGSIVFADLGTLGLWKYDGTSWSKLAPENPEAIAASGSIVYADLGSLGLWKHDGASWSKLAPENPEAIAASGSILFADLGTLGLWKYEGTSWSKLAPENPENIAASGSIVFADLGTLGLWKYEGTSWSKLAPENPENIAASGSIVYADLGTLGLWKYEGTSWSKLAPENPENIAVGF